MTEAEWLICIDPHTMLELVRNTASERKLRLFAVACCRRVWHLLIHEASRKAVEVGERFADGWASEEERQAAFEDADDILGVYLAIASDLDAGNVTAELEPYCSLVSAAGISLDTA